MKRISLLPLFVLLCVMATATSACDDAETTAQVDNTYPTTADGGFDSTKSIAVYRAWWLVTVFADPIAAGTSSDAHRVVSGTDSAYYLLAPGWDPSSGAAPTVLVAAKSNDAVHVDRGKGLHLTVDDAHVTGNCAAGHPLSQADADYITRNIFAGEFAGFSCDAASCTMIPDPTDGGADGGDVEADADCAVIIRTVLTRRRSGTLPPP